MKRLFIIIAASAFVFMTACKKLADGTVNETETAGQLTSEQSITSNSALAHEDTESVSEIENIQTNTDLTKAETSAAQPDLPSVVPSKNIIPLTEGSNSNLSVPSDYINRAVKTSESAEIQSVDYDDFDGNGTYEAFAVLTDKNKNGSLWFMTDNDMQKIMDLKSVQCRRMIINADKNKIMLLSESRDSDWMFFTLINSKPAKLNISGYSPVCFIENNRMFLNDSGDGTASLSYCFYFDGGNFHEYGGIEITADELSQFKNSDEAYGGLLQSGAIIENIIYRENRTVTINFKRNSSDGSAGLYFNQTFSFDKSGRLTLIKESAGITKTALIPEFASYPDKFIPPDK